MALSIRRTTRATLLAALASAAVACGGGGGASPPPPPPPPAPPPPGSNASPSFTSPAAVSTRENAIGVVYRPVATDPEGGTVTYGATIGGPDAAQFVMNPVTREVRFSTQPDFEAPGDAGANNVYNISFTASDGINTTTHNVAITVTNVANGFRVRRVASGLSSPIFAAGLPDGSGRVVIVERAGRMRVLTPSTGALAATDFLNITPQVSTAGEKGLLGLAFSPDFLVDRNFYIHMNPASANTTEIRRYRTPSSYDIADPNSADAILTVAQPSATNHKGGTVAFDTAGRLLISMGDGGNTPQSAQDRDSLLGKILRVDPSTDAFPADDTRDYAIPPSNPFSGGGGAAEVYAMGLRNPFRMSVDNVTGDVFIGDVGQSAIEEVDRISSATTAVVNFGWDRREGSQPYNGGADDPSFTPPVTEYGRSIGTTVTGGVVYRGPVEDLQGQYIFGDFGSDTLWSVPVANLVIGSVLPAASLTVRNAAFNPDAGTIDNVVAFGTDTDGNVYIVDIGGEVFVIEPLP